MRHARGLLAYACAYACACVRAQYFARPTSCLDLSTRLDVVNAACSTSTGSNCTLPCALSVGALVHNVSCMAIADRMLDVEGTDTKEDGTASSLRDYAAFCVEHQSSEALLANIVQLNAEGCAVDTTSLAMGVPSAPVALCRDNTPAMREATGFTCVQILSQHMCGLVTRGMLPNLCTCACPKPAATPCADVSAAVMSNKTGGDVPNCAVAKAVHLCQRDPQTAEQLCPVTCAIGCGSQHLVHHRLLFGQTVGLHSKCPMKEFESRRSSIRATCCEGEDCHAGLPTVCTLQCANVFPKFVSDCHSLIASQDDGNADAYATLAHSCSSLPPKSQMMSVILNATCPTGTHSPSAAPTSAPSSILPTVHAPSNVLLDVMVQCGQVGTNCRIKGFADRQSTDSRQIVEYMRTETAPAGGTLQIRQSLQGWGPTSAVVFSEAASCLRVADASGYLSPLELGNIWSLDTWLQPEDSLGVRERTLIADVYGDSQIVRISKAGDVGSLIKGKWYPAFSARGKRAHGMGGSPWFRLTVACVDTFTYFYLDYVMMGVIQHPAYTAQVATIGNNNVTKVNTHAAPWGMMGGLRITSDVMMPAAIQRAGCKCYGSSDGGAAGACGSMINQSPYCYTTSHTCPDRQGMSLAGYTPQTSCWACSKACPWSCADLPAASKVCAALGPCKHGQVPATPAQLADKLLGAGQLPITLEVTVATTPPAGTPLGTKSGGDTVPTIAIIADQGVALIGKKAPFSALSQWRGRFMVTGGNLIILWLRFKGLNNTNGQGGVVYIDGGEVAVTGSAFESTFARNGGVMYIRSGRLSLKGCLFSANMAVSGGSAFWVQGTGTNISLSDSSVLGSQCNGCTYPAALFVLYGAIAHLSNVTFSGSTPNKALGCHQSVAHYQGDQHYTTRVVDSASFRACWWLDTASATASNG